MSKTAVSKVNKWAKLGGILKRREFWIGATGIVLTVGTGVAKIGSKRKYILGGLFLVLTIAFSVALIYYWEEIEYLWKYGYPFVFLVSFLAGCSIPNPLPYIVVVFTLAAKLDPTLVGVTSGLAAGIGGTLVYLAGRGGGKFFSKIGFLSPNTGGTSTSTSRASRWTSRIIDWAQRRGAIVVFIMSAVFNPIFAPAAIAMGVLRFPLWKFFVMCWAGNTVKSLIIAYSGYFGLGTLLRWLGISV